MKISAVILLGLVFLPVLFAQPAEEIHSKIRALAAERSYLAAIVELKNLERKYPDIFVLNNYDYLLARLSERSGDAAAAIANYQKVAARDSVLQEYALFHLSRTARTTGNFMLERIYLQELLAFSPQSLLRDAAENRMARSWFDSGNYDLAIKALGTRPAGIDRPQSSSKRPVEIPLHARTGFCWRNLIFVWATQRRHARILENCLRTWQILRSPTILPSLPQRASMS